jgi:multidrug efflux pump subunit AcrA (membrane-fusion protein)
MKRVFIILSIIILVAIGFISIGLVLGEIQEHRINQYETETLDRGTIFQKVEADGVVTSHQTSLLFWKITGEVDDVFVKPGYQVSAGTTLASIKASSTPAQLLYAQVEKLSAEIALDL